MPVLQQYLEILKDYFGKEFTLAQNNGFDKKKYLPQVWKTYNNRTLRSSTLESLAYDVAKLNWEKLENEAREADGLKVHYVGAEYSYRQSPKHTTEFLRKTGVYTDKIIVEEQTFNRLHNWEKLRSTDAVFNQVLDDVIDFLTLEPLFTLDSEEDFCLLAPASSWCFKHHGLQDRVTELQINAGVEYASELFGRRFSSYDEYVQFIESITSHDHFLSLIVNDEGFVSQANEKITPEWISNFINSFDVPLSPQLVYETLVTGNYGGRINDLVYNGLLGTTPVTDLKPSWNAMNWLIRNDNNRLYARAGDNALSKHAFVVNALQQERLRWLGNVPIDKLTQLRERGEIIDLRRLIGDEIEEIENCSDEDFFEVANQVNYNINTALKKHSTAIGDIKTFYSSKYNFDIKCYIVSGAFAITSALFQPVASAQGILTALSGVVPSTLQTLRDYYEERSRLKELQKKPVAVLFEAKEASG